MNIEESPLYSPDLAPVPQEKRNWGTLQLAALWVGMAVCIPTYLLASYMIKAGLSWLEAVLIIIIGNVIITLPMVLNGKPGVKYGLPFPVIGRAAFGTQGIHLAALLRGIVACGWFGIQTWIGGLSIYAIYCAIAGVEPATALTFGKFAGFAVFWFINIFFIVKGNDSIKWLEEWSAPILLAMGLFLIGWGWYGAGGFGVVLKQSGQLAKQTAAVYTDAGVPTLEMQLISDKEGKIRATHYQLKGKDFSTDWQPITSSKVALAQILPSQISPDSVAASAIPATLQVRQVLADGSNITSSEIRVAQAIPALSPTERLWSYILWLTAMVGFWATMSISISDITRYARDQRSQTMGQFIGLPGTMALYSFVGIFVTCAAIINFADVLVAEDAPWDPVTLLGRFESPVVVVIAQIFMLIATLSTNIAANVVAPSYAFANLFPRHLTLAKGGIVTGIVGIVICPWWLMDSISGLLLFVSGLLGPVLGVLMADYFVVRRQELNVNELYNPSGIYAGINAPAFVAVLAGVAVALLGWLVPALGFLYNLSWFIGFGIAFLLYVLLGLKNT